MNRRILLAAVLILVGLAGVLSPIFFFEFHEARYAVTFGDNPDDPESLDDSQIVRYGELPAETKENLPHVLVPSPIGSGNSVEDSYGGFTAAEWATTTSIRSHEYIRLPTDVASQKGDVWTIETHTYDTTPRYLGATGDAFYPLVGGWLLLPLGISLYRTKNLLPLTSGMGAVLAAAGVSGVGVYRNVVQDSLGNSPYNYDPILVFANGYRSVVFTFGVGAGFAFGVADGRKQLRYVAVPLFTATVSLVSIFSFDYGTAGGVTVMGVFGGSIGLFVGLLLGQRR